MNTIEKYLGSDSPKELINNITVTYCNLVVKHRKSQYSTPVIKALKKIETDIGDDLSLKNLSNLNNVSAGYFSALFKKEVGTTLTDYVNRQRVSHAKYLLSTTRLQIGNIGNTVGIRDTNYFIKLFKKYEGMTPKEYRNISKVG